jgi:hypothetical protein
MGWMVVAGKPAVAGGTGRQSLVQTRTSDAYRGRVFGALGAVDGVALLVGFGLGGVLGDAVGIVPVLSASAGLRVLGGVVTLGLLPRQERRPTADAAMEQPR